MKKPKRFTRLHFILYFVIKYFQHLNGHLFEGHVESLQRRKILLAIQPELHRAKTSGFVQFSDEYDFQGFSHLWERVTVNFGRFL